MADALDRYMRGTSDNLEETTPLGEKTEKDILIEENKCWNCKVELQKKPKEESYVNILRSSEKNYEWVCPQCNSIIKVSCEELYKPSSDKEESYLEDLSSSDVRFSKKIEHKCGKIFVIRGEGGGHYYCDEPQLEGHHWCKFHSLTSMYERLR